jgi:AcrR family transcriptional regulator
MAGTKELLLQTAERLFAERGISAVSLREIGETAEQRNTAAVHYHFGDKDGLVEAIFEFRAEQINACREGLLAALVAEGRTRDVAALAEALVLPLADQLNPRSRYVGFLSRLQSEPGWSRSQESVDLTVSASYRRVVQLLRAPLRDLPAEVFNNRVLLVTGLIPQALAARQAGVRPPVGRALSTDAFVGDLVAAVTGLLSAASPSPAA